MAKRSKIPKGKVQSFLTSQKEKLRLQRQQSKIDLLFERTKGITSPEELMDIILQIFDQTEVLPQVGKFYTFRYAAKTPKIKYDRHPLITMLSYDDKGFEGLNVHWRTRRRYNWEQVMSSFHVLEREEFNALRRIPYARFVINR